MNAIIISVGDELVSGQVVDTNSAYLSQQMLHRGIRPIAHLTVGDNIRTISDALTQASKAAQIVLVTGGLGPTTDDVTREALAETLGVELVLDEASLAEIEEFFRRRGKQMPQSNRRQALIPHGSESLSNKLGTAGGIAALLADAHVFIMPGVPREMRKMFEDHVAARLPASPDVIIQRVIHTFGEGESSITTMLGDIMDNRSGDAVVGVTAMEGKVSLRITVRSKSRDTAQRQADELVAEIRKRLGGLIVGEDDETLAEVIGKPLRRRKETLATAESCTGGLIGEMITDVSGSSDYYIGSVIAYANDAKTALLGVPAEVLADSGAVSEQTAEAMARGCKERFGCDWAISVTGIAGPTGGSSEKPVGLVYIGLSGPDICEVYRHVLTGERHSIRHRAATTALNHLRLVISNQ